MRKHIVALLIAVAALSAAAESTRFWQQNLYEQFARGSAQDVALRSDGEILLAPRFAELADTRLEFHWTQAEDAKGNLYVGGGSPAQVLKIDPAGQVSTVFDSTELEVHALVAAPDGALYVATSPDGKVYKVAANGEKSVFFEPKTKYLWDLARDARGHLYLATGDKGEVFRIAPDGKGEVFFRSGESHVRALAFDPNGTLYAGTEPNGLVLRLQASGEGFVVNEMPNKEVTALVFDARGHLFVAAIGDKPPRTIQPATVQQAAAQQAAQAAEAMAAAQAAAATQRVPLPAAGGSDIFRIAPDGYPEPFWESANELVYAIAFDAKGQLLAGTGNAGKILGIDSPTLYTHLAKAGGQQVTGLLRSKSGRVYALTTNPGKVYTLGPELAAEGRFESEVYDAALFSEWGQLAWQSRSANAPGSVQLFTRSGNTSDPQKNWSAWSPAGAAAGERIASPAARFLQWKAVLKASDARAPSLSSVSVAYLRRNAAPAIERILVQAPGVRVRSMHSPQPMGTEPARLEMPPPAGRQTRRSGMPPQTPQPQPQRPEIPPQGFTEPGARSVLWSAEDENGDDLVYGVYFRGEGETRWKLMKDNFAEKFYSWDSATLPDGAYFIRVTASDSPSNPADLALTGENTSDRFEVDNTPPRIEELEAKPQSRTVEVRFVARDSYSAVKHAQYSLDAADWKPVFPVTRTTDAPEERFVLRIENLEPGEHTIVVRAYDRFDNAGLAKATFTVR